MTAKPNDNRMTAQPNDGRRPNDVPKGPMTPQRNTNATLIDLLDRVLDKGLVIHADVIVSVAGIPLIGVNLRAALAGMETMLEYGVMQAWDENSRAWERENRKKKQEVLIAGEKVLLKTQGACHSSKGLYKTWQYGRFYLTPSRLILYYEGFGKILFETPLEKIRGIGLSERQASPENKTRQELHLLLEGNRWCRLTAHHVQQLRKNLETAIFDSGYNIQDLSEKETETCPQCGSLDFVQALLANGCGQCGWTSPVPAKKIQEIKALS